MENILKHELLKKLLYQIADGNPGAFNKFYNIYFHKVYRFSTYFIKPHEICEEIVSDVFLTIWNNRMEIANIKNIEAFLFTVTKHKAYNYLDQVTRKPVFTDKIPFEFTKENCNDTPEDIILTKELQNTIKASIDELPKQCKLIFIMSREEGLRHQDIAQILHISEKTVDSQIITALKKLHLTIKKHTS
jgi:RNA polymerase sigma-70 factor (family 1)